MNRSSRFPNDRSTQSARGVRTLVTSCAAALVACVLAYAAFAGGDDPAPPKGKEQAPTTIPDGKKCVDCHAKWRGKTLHTPVARNECGPCHEQDGNRHAFKLADASDLCTQCHDMELPGKPHDPVAKKLCRSCHDPHASDLPHLAKAPDTVLCGSCHTKEMADRKKYVHGPFAVGTCQVCHAPHSSPNPKLLRRPGSELCLSCHDKFSPEGAKALVEHAPAKDDCAKCHSGHQSDVRYLLTAESRELCLGCHKDFAARIKDAPVEHKALSQPGSCAICHDPHASRNARLLKTESSDLCLSCHDRPYAQANGARPLADMAALLKHAPQQHGPVREKACEGCHDPHGSKVFRLLKKDYPAKFYAPFSADNFALCFSCHPKDLAESKESTTTGFRDGKRSLHFLHVNRKKGRTCRACHETHASGLPHHLRETTPFGQWDVPIGFTETPGGGTCAPGCHTAQTYDRGK